jgi:hypothetical protein
MVISHLENLDLATKPFCYLMLLELAEGRGAFQTRLHSPRGFKSQPVFSALSMARTPFQVNHKYVEIDILMALHSSRHESAEMYITAAH